MSFASYTTSVFRSSSTGGGSRAALHIPATTSLVRSTSGVVPHWKLLNIASRLLLQCNATSISAQEEYMDDVHDSLQTYTLNNGTEQEMHDYYTKRVPVSEKITELVSVIRSILQKMDDGAISISPYDTAWVALVEDTGGSHRPQFPSSLEWISNNQLPDGSWGDSNRFLIYDRLLNTIACVVALKTWKMHYEKCDKGVSFIRENIKKLDEESEEHMLNGFEVVFPSLMEKAKMLNIDIPDDSPGLKNIYAKRDLKFARIPMDVLHTVPTTLLFSLEGINAGLQWGKLQKLQASNGSFFYSPASTAFALQQTSDHKCLQYLLKLVHKFNGGVPNVYPVDLFERLWAVDRLQRLGISHFFQPEINASLDYVYRYWSNTKGIYVVRDSKIQDVDDTAMGFRLLRMHGYDISPDVFKQFENGGEFFCFAGQTSESVTAMYSLYRASQVMFPHENILADGKKFSTNFLQERRATNNIRDKWIITKDLPGEVGYALEVPWFASLPRVETRFFIEQYGGEDDVWIGKCLYRMGNVNNNKYLELAKLDYNNCQELHQQEWKSIQQWYRSCSIGESELSGNNLILAYYIAAATIFEPKKSRERLAWAKTAILVKTIASQQLSREQKRAFIIEFEHCSILKTTDEGRYNTRSCLVRTLIGTVSKLSEDTLLTQDGDIHRPLYCAWRKWLAAWEKGDEGDIELFVSTLNLCRGLDESLFSHREYKDLLKITIRVCNHLRKLQNNKVKEREGCMAKARDATSDQVESNIQELVKLVLTKSSSGNLDFDTKQNFLAIAKSFYYNAHCDPRTIDFHITKVLFERVI